MMKKTIFSRAAVFMMVLVMVLSCVACQDESGDDNSLTESVFEFIEEFDEDSDTQSNTGDASGSSSTSNTSNGKSGGKVTLDTKNIAGDSAAQQALQASLKDTAKGKTLTILSTWGDDGLMNQCYKAMFKTLCGGELKVIRCADWSGMQQKLASMHAANNAPDLYEVTNQDYPSVVYRGIIEPLSDHINFNDAVYTKSDKELLSQLKFNGKNYFWPTFTDPTGSRTGVWVNKSVLEQAGVPANQMPDALMRANNWTWDTMYDLIKRATNKSKGIYGFAAPQEGSFSYGIAASTGEDYVKYTSDGIMSNFTSVNITRAMNMYKKMEDPNYCVVDKAIETFESGKAALMYSNAGQITRKKLNAMAKDGVIEIVPLARDPQQKNYNVFAAISGLAVPSGSKNKAAAINFIKMLRASNYYNKQVSEIYYEQNGFTKQAIQFSNDCINKYRMVPITSLGIKEILGLTWKAVGNDYVQGNTTWETRAAEFSPQIQSILDKIG